MLLSLETNLRYCKCLNLSSLTDNDVTNMQQATLSTDMMAIDGRNAIVQLADHCRGYNDVQRLGPKPQYDEDNGVNDFGSGLDDGDAAAIASAQQIQLLLHLFLSRYILLR